MTNAATPKSSQVPNSPNAPRGSRMIGVLLVVIALEGLLLTAHSLWFRPAAPPPVKLTGYPAATQQAVAAVLEDVRQEPADPVRWSRLGDTLFACGRYAAAEACYRQRVALQPDEAQPHYDLGFCLMSTGRLQEANTAFTAAARLATALLPTQHYYAGLNALRDGNSDVARTEFLQAATLPAAQLQLAILDLRDGQTEQAESRLLSLRESRPNASRVHQLLADLYARTDRPQPAAESAQLAELLSGIVAGPWNERAAMLLDETSHLSVAHKVARLAQRLSDATQRGTGTPTAELQRLQEDITADLEQQWDPLLEDLLADVAAASGNQLQQCQHLRNIIQRDGATTYRLNRLGFALISTGQRSAGREALETGFRLAHAATDGAGVDNCFALADFMRNDDPDLADTYQARGHRLAGLLAQDQQRFADAMTQFAASLALAPDQTEVWFWQAQTARLLGKNDVARRACERCLQYDPQHAAARRLADELTAATTSASGPHARADDAAADGTPTVPDDRTNEDSPNDDSP